MKSKVCLKYFVHDCSPVLTHNYLFYLTSMWFSQSTQLLIYFSLENLTSIIRTGQPVLVDLKGLINSAVTALSQMALLKQLTSQLESLTVTFTVLLFWIYLFLLTLVFVLQQLSLQWEILIILLSQFPLNFFETQKEIVLSITQVMTKIVQIRIVFLIILEMLYGWISLDSVLLRLVLNFARGSRLKLMCISLIVNIR